MRYGVSGHMTAPGILNLVLIYGDIPFNHKLLDKMLYNIIAYVVHIICVLTYQLFALQETFCLLNQIWSKRCRKRDCSPFLKHDEGLSMTHC